MTSDEERLISGQAWEDWCDRLKSVGRSILAEGFPDSPRERAEGVSFLKDGIETRNADFNRRMTEDFKRIEQHYNPDTNIMVIGKVFPTDFRGSLNLKFSGIAQAFMFFNSYLNFEVGSQPFHIQTTGLLTQKTDTDYSNIQRLEWEYIEAGSVDEIAQLTQQNLPLIEDELDQFMIFASDESQDQIAEVLKNRFKTVVQGDFFLMLQKTGTVEDSTSKSE